MPAPALREVQRAFWGALATAPTGACTASGPATIHRRFDVYRNAYVWRLQDVLREDFPRLAALVGRDGFDALTRQYLRTHPSEHPSVRYLGRRMAEYLTERGQPALADLARLELARTDAFDAADATVLSADALRAVTAEDWPRLSFTPVPSLALLELDWPAHQLWEGRTVAQSEATRLRVWRAADHTVLHAVLDPQAAQTLRRMSAGAPFAALCEVFADAPEMDAASAIVGLLARWIEDGVVAGYSIS